MKRSTNSSLAALKRNNQRNGPGARIFRVFAILMHRGPGFLLVVHEDNEGAVALSTVSKMKFGIGITPQHPITDSPVARFRESVQQAMLARDAGFDAVTTGQHFLSPPYQSLQSVPLLSRLAADTGGMRLVVGVMLLPLLNPVQVAEEIATLDVISEGRTIFGVGLGYREVEFEAFGVKVSERVGRMIESLELIKRLWSEDRVTFEGKFFRVHDATSTIRPVQRPHPPIWIAANADVAVARAGRLGYPWFVNPHAAMPTIERQWAIYREALEKAGHPIPDDRPIALELHVAPAREEAIAIARPYLEAKYSAYADWGQDKALPGGDSFRVDFDKLARDRFVLESRSWKSASSGWPRISSSSAWAGPGWRTIRYCGRSS
jgi:alkanesulfonate monooxygenase SsuD/methylene tetrahydromethanopterin reductase-like flavin-dependent oxidoreductase (luciferase family)